MTMQCPVVSAHDMQRLSRWTYRCEDHGVTVVFHAPGPLSSPPPRSRTTERGSTRRAVGSDGPVYVAKDGGRRYHVTPSCYTLGKCPAPVITVTSRSKAESDGRTPCGACVKKQAR